MNTSWVTFLLPPKISGYEQGQRARLLHYMLIAVFIGAMVNGISSYLNGWVIETYVLSEPHTSVLYRGLDLLCFILCCHNLAAVSWRRVIRFHDIGLSNIPDLHSLPVWHPRTLHCDDFFHSGNIRNLYASDQWFVRVCLPSKSSACRDCFSPIRAHVRCYIVCSLNLLDDSVPPERIL